MCLGDMNNKDGWQKFVTKYCSILDKSLVVMETTGGYEIDLLKHLLRAIALYAYERYKHLKIYKDQNELKLLIARRQDLVKILVQEKNCSHVPVLKQISKSLKAVIGVLEE